MTTLQQAEAAEHAMSQELDRVVVKSAIYTSGERDPRVPAPRPPDNGKLYLMADDPRLPKMPDKPTLFDFFRYRFGPSAHLLAERAARPEEWCEREDRPRLPPARHRHRGIHPLGPRVLERAAPRALCRPRGELGHPVSPGPALLPGRGQRIPLSGAVHEAVRRGLRARAISKSRTGSRAITSGT